MPAFRHAVALGAHMIELDVQCTRDGAVMVLHDDGLERTTDGRGPAVTKRWDEIAALDAGRWFAPAFAGTRVPLLAEVLAEIPLPVNVELKSPGGDDLEARTLAVVRAAGAMDRVVFSSFDPESLVRLRACAGDADLAVLVPGSSIRPAREVVERVGARAVHIRKGRGDAEAVREAHTAGLRIRVWTVNNSRDFARLAAAGADAIFTDFPERFLLYATG